MTDPVPPESLPVPETGLHWGHWGHWGARVFNFRDVGGYPAAGGRTVRRRRLFRSDHLGRLTEADREPFLALGIRTVIDLRRPYEIARDGRVPQWNGLTYRHIDPDHREWTEAPYAEGDDPRRYLADRYRDLAEEGAPALAEAVAVLADPAAAPAVVHCVAGKDRTGVVCALALSLLGVGDDDIDADYARSSAGQDRFMAWARANDYPYQPTVWHRARPGAMNLFLAELRERHGSVERYLTTAGLAPGRIDSLREHLLSQATAGR